MTAPGPDKRLPELRPELELVKGAPGASGQPTWLLHDPILNRFLQIDIATREVLQHWRAGEPVIDLVGRVNAGGRVEIDGESAEQLISFLYTNRLTVDAPSQGWRHYAREADARHHSLLMSLVHNYLFFRIPLCRPQRFLELTLPAARTLASGPMQLLIAALGAAGLYLVSREWDAFTGMFQGYFTWESAMLMAIALAIVKAAHELGHAYTTVAYGCRVHTMGIAFVLMAPLLYTDVTDSWRLRERRQRLMIDSAGIKVELAIAAVALFLWAFLPDGAARSLAFTLSVVSIASSLIVNLNPFMRFDGYYLIAEALGVDNLQSRAFAFGRWKFRQWLFGIADPPPEELPRRLVRSLIVYAWAVWIYRLVLFVGIALLVYHYFFKVLGIALFALEMVFFVGRPIMNEMKIWYRMRGRILATSRTLATVVVVGLGLGVCLVPWSTRVEIPAIAESKQLQPIHSGVPARVVGVHVRQGAVVKVGEAMVTLSSPEIDQQIRQVCARLALARLQHGRRGADTQDRADSIVLESSISSLLTQLEGLEKERQELTLRAPFDGMVVDFDTTVSPGRWVSPKDVIAIVAGRTGIAVRGYVSQADRARIAPGATGIFVPEGPMRRAIPVKVDRLAVSSAAEIDIAELASVYAGRIAVQANNKKRLVPTSAQYLVGMSALTDGDLPELSLRGVVLAEGEAESVLARVWRQTLKVLVRESGA